MQTWEDGMDAIEFYTSHPRLMNHILVEIIIVFI
jgi:hypothetical protein